jgi:hypothetical protein
MKATVVNGGATASQAAAGESNPAASHASEQAFQGLDRAALLDVYRCMVLSRKLDDKEIQLKNQSRVLSDQRGRTRSRARRRRVDVAARLRLVPRVLP